MMTDALIKSAYKYANDNRKDILHKHLDVLHPSMIHPFVGKKTIEERIAHKIEIKGAMIAQAIQIGWIVGSIRHCSGDSNTDLDMFQRDDHAIGRMNKDTWDYDPANDNFFMNGTIIYSKGTWAQII